MAQLYNVLYKIFLECPTFHNLAHKFHKQVPAHCLQPGLLAFICSPPPPLLYVIGALMCHPSQFLSCRSGASPHFPPLPLAWVVFVPSPRRAAPCMHPSPQCYLNPFPSIFTLPASFQGSSLLPYWGVHKTQIGLLMAAFPDTDS